MDFYGQSTTGQPTWYEAVNSEFFYEQNQIQDMKSNNQHMYMNSAVSVVPTSPILNVHEQPLTMLSTIEQTHTNIEYYQQPSAMHFNNDANYLSPPPPPPPLQQHLPLPSTSFVDDGNSMVSYAPCQGPRPWNFAQCYGFYGQPPCSLLNIIDMEDFM